MFNWYTIVVTDHDSGETRIMATPGREDIATIIMDSYENDMNARYTAILFSKGGKAIRTVSTTKNGI